MKHINYHLRQGPHAAAYNFNEKLMWLTPTIDLLVDEGIFNAYFLISNMEVEEATISFPELLPDGFPKRQIFHPYSGEKYYAHRDLIKSIDRDDIAEYHKDEYLSIIRSRESYFGRGLFNLLLRYYDEQDPCSCEKEHAKEAISKLLKESPIGYEWLK